MLAAVNHTLIITSGMAMIDRRTIVTATLAALAGPASIRAVLAQPAMSRITAYAFSFPALAGGDIRLADCAGRPLLIVNTASLCGYTRNMPACSNYGASSTTGA